MTKELVIEGCFDLFHEDHSTFITRCIERFSKVHGYTPVVRIHVMSNEWTHRKGPLRPFLDVSERISTVQRFFPDALVSEAQTASFDHERSEFEKEFNNAVIAILPDNFLKVPFLKEQYLLVEPVNQIHTTDVESAILKICSESRCAVRKVGAALIEDGRIIHKACNACTCADSDSCPACTMFLKGDIAPARELGCNGQHAEAAVLASLVADKKDLILLTTTAPCPSCAQMIVDAGIRTVVYFKEWIRSSENQDGHYIDMSGVHLLETSGVKIRKAGI